MPVITYTAKNRGELVSGHTAGSTYQIQFNLQAYPRRREIRGSMEQTNNGTPEGWFQANVFSWGLVTDRVFEAAIQNWEEFFSSVLNGESFTIDLTGTIASPGTVYTVWMPDRTIEREQLIPRDARYSFRVQRL